MTSISEWIKKKCGERFRSHEGIYEKEKELLEEAIGRSKITITIEMPRGYENQRGDFEELRNDKDFLNDVKQLVKEHLDRKKAGREGQK